MNTNNNLITHEYNYKVDLARFDISDYEKKLQASSDLTLPYSEMTDLLKQLSQFELGKFLLINKGLNGYWTSYAINNALASKDLHPLENWLLNKSPAICATRERFHIFREETQKLLHNNIKLASVPCGLMDDLLSLNYTGLNNIALTGIDLDQESLDLAKKNEDKYHLGAKALNVQTEYLLKDAWNLNLYHQFDILTTNGLNVYVPDDRKVVELYNQLYLALKPGGKLISSFLTPPPTLTKNSTWTDVDPKELMLQKAIIVDIIGAHWQTFRTQEITTQQLESLGFHDLKYIYDSKGIYPTVIAEK